MSTGIAKRDPGQALEEMTRRIMAQVQAQSGDEFVMEIMDRIAGAGSIDEIFAMQESGMVSGQDFAGRPFLIRGREDIKWMPSGQEKIDQGAFPAYAIIRAVEYGAEPVTIACGGKTFVAVLDALIQARFFDTDYVDPIYGAMPEDGRCVMIHEVPSPSGAYLQLKPFKRPETGSAKPRK